MPNCEIIINGIMKNLEIDRPSFKFFKEKYLEILNTKNSLFLQNKFKDAIYKQLIVYKINKEEAKLESEKISDSNLMEEQELIVYPRYAKIGGKLLEEYVRFIIDKKYNWITQGNPNEKYPNFDNSCALCVSYAFNEGGMPIKNLCNLPSNTLKGEDENLYYTGVPKIKELPLNNWKNLKKPYSESNNKDFYKVFYRNKQEYFSIISDSILLEQIKNENEKFFNTLKSLNQNGIITMDIDSWDNAGGHTTFWDKEKGFLDEINYLSHLNEKIFVRELCFWKI